MSDALVVCAGCYRHVRSSECACVFCSAVVGAPTVSRPGALHTAVIAAALALAVADRASAQQNPPTSSRFGMQHGGAEGYGAPPHPGMLLPDPLRPAPPAQTVLVTVPSEAAPVFEFARRRRPAPNRRPRASAPWTVAVTIRGDGTWISAGRSGRLSPSQMAQLQAAIARTTRVSEPVTLVPIPPSFSMEERVLWGTRTATWPGPSMGGTPGRDMRHLIELAFRLTRSRP